MTPPKPGDQRERNERIRAFLDWPSEDALVEDVCRMAAILATKSRRATSRILFGMARAVDGGITDIEQERRENWNAMERAVQMPDRPEETEMEECDYCGEEFPAKQADRRAAEEDHCVCPECVGYHRQQMKAMGE
jgi:hypothetical protein